MKMRAEKLWFLTSPPLPLSLLLFQLFSEKNVYSKLARFCSINQALKREKFHDQKEDCRIGRAI